MDGQVSSLVKTKAASKQTSDTTAATQPVVELESPHNGTALATSDSYIAISTTVIPRAETVIEDGPAAPTEPLQPASAGVVASRDGDIGEASSGAGTMVQASSPTDWSTLLGYSSQGLGAANSASSTGLAFARGATTFGLNLAKRITQGLVALPAMAVDGAITGAVPNSSDGTLSMAKVAHMAVGGFFDAISTVALGGINVTSAITGAGLGAAGTGVEGLRRWLGSEVLQSLKEFGRLVKREWNADDDALPPGGIPAYRIVSITQALTTWVCIQLVTRKYQETRMLKSMIEVDLDDLATQLTAVQRQEELERKDTSELALAATDAISSEPDRPTFDPPGSPESMRITSNERMPGEEGNIIGAEIGSEEKEDTSPFKVPQSSAHHPLSNLEALRGLQRYSKLVLGMYGGLAMAWLGTLPAMEQVAATATAGKTATESSATIFSAEEEFLSHDQAQFLEAAASMDLPEEPDSDDVAFSRMPGHLTQPTSPAALAPALTASPDDRNVATEAATSTAAGEKQSTTRPDAALPYSYMNIISGQHDNALFEKVAKLETGAAQEGSYDEHTPRSNPDGKARPSKPRFYVVTDHPRKVVVLVLRGSLSLGDAAADLTCESVPFSFHPSVGDLPDPARASLKSSFEAKGRPLASDGYGEDRVHEGMLLTAREIGDVGRPVNRTVARALKRNDGYALEIAGHSLGAGVSAILTMMWGDPRTGLTIAASGLPAGRCIHSYCFAVPCITSETLARKCSSLVTSHVYSYDFVTRLSLGAIQDIRNGCAWLCYENAEASKRVPRGDQARGGAASPKKMSSLMRKAFEHQAGWLDSAEGEEKAQVETDFLSLRKTLEANMHGTHLFPPGKVLYSVPSGDLSSSYEGRSLSAPRLDRDRLFTIDDKPGSLQNVFGQIIFSRTMLSSHMPSVYDQALHRLPH